MDENIHNIVMDINSFLASYAPIATKLRGQATIRAPNSNNNNNNNRYGRPIQSLSLTILP